MAPDSVSISGSSPIPAELRSSSRIDTSSCTPAGSVLQSTQDEMTCCRASHSQSIPAAGPVEKNVAQERLETGIDPVNHIRSGDTVLILGASFAETCAAALQATGEQRSGAEVDGATGIATQSVAAESIAAPGRVMIVDRSPARLDAIRRRLSSPEFSEVVSLVELRKGRLPDLKLDLDRFDVYFQTHPCQSGADWLLAEEHSKFLQETEPLVPADTVDVVLLTPSTESISQSDRQRLFSEIYRVLRRGGQVVISDLVSDETVPDAFFRRVGSGSECLVGVYREDRLLEALEAAGFHGIEILERDVEPLKTINGIEFRKIVVRAFKGKAGPCLERRQGVIYNGPWKAVVDDDGHTLYRGKRMAVCDKTFQIYTQAPYVDDITPVLPRVLIPLEAASMMACGRTEFRDPRETKASSPTLDAAKFESLKIDSSALELLPPTDCGGTNCC